MRSGLILAGIQTGRRFPCAAAIGAGVWLVTTVGFSLPLAEALLVFAPLVLLPLGFRLLEHDSKLARAVIRLQPPGALLLLASFLVPRGLLAALLVVPWLLVTSMMAAWGAVRCKRTVRGTGQRLCESAALSFVAVGGTATLMSRGGLRLLDFSDEIVLLTGVHFHYAGFVLPLLTGLASRYLPPAVARLMILGVVIGVPMVGVGITFSPLVEVVSVAVLVVACMVLALAQARLAFAAKRPVELMLFGISATSLFSAMVLAAVYAWSEYLGAEWIDIPAMIRFHGTANSFGFACCGLLAWESRSGLDG